MTYNVFSGTLNPTQSVSQPPSGELNTTGVAKYNDFGPIEGYISQRVQDMR